MDKERENKYNKIINPYVIMKKLATLNYLCRPPF